MLTHPPLSSIHRPSLFATYFPAYNEILSSQSGQDSLQCCASLAANVYTATILPQLIYYGFYFYPTE
jgi:hypothetical protein